MDNIAIWISIFSVLIAAISLGWNIHRDLSKPKLKVNFGLNLIFGERGVEGGPILTLSGTNLGPGKITLNGISLKRPWSRIKKLFKKAIYGFLVVYDYRSPHSSRFPCEADVGERKDFILIYDKDCFLKENFIGVGIGDSFGRIHWAPRNAYKMVKKEFEKQLKKPMRETT
jgi:hypothetical protein